MAGLQRVFFGMPASQLQPLLTDAMNCLTGVLAAGQAYSIGGRQFTRANIAELRNTIMELNAAIAAANGTRTTVTVADQNPNPISAGPQTNFQASAPGG